MRMPTLEEEFIINVGVALLGVFGHMRAVTPDSKTMLPVVCIRMRSDTEEPRKMRSS